MDYQSVLEVLGNESFGVLAGASTSEIVVYARNFDTSIGDLFLIPSDRGGERVYIFRMTQYANVLRREDEMEPMAKNLIAMDDPFYADDFERDKLLRLTGSLLGYSEFGGGKWAFRSPRKLPAHLSRVFKIGFGDEATVASQERVLSDLLEVQLRGGVRIGALLAGEQALQNVQVGIPGEYFAHHIGIFGRTGTGKSNNMMVLIESIYENNRNLLNISQNQWQRDDRIVSLFAIDPHDEFARWKAGSTGGITQIIAGVPDSDRSRLVGDFFYLSCRPQVALDADQELGGKGRTCYLSRRDITPSDLISIMEFTDIMSASAEAIGDEHGENWISAILNGQVEPDDRVIHKASLAAINRRLSFLAGGRSVLVPNHRQYNSCLADIIIALEQGRVLDVDTTLMTEAEQFLLTTVVARAVFALRKALKSANCAEDFFGNTNSPGELDRHFPLQESLKANLRQCLADVDSPYLDAGQLKKVADLPAVNIVIEEAPSILNPARLRFGSVFRDISRQGRKFGLGLTVISQQVTEIDNGILSQLNTELNMAMGNEEERRAAVQTASNDIYPFKRELQVMSVGQAILSASYKRVPLPIQIPEFI
jgi:DNA helicase HerA-like ATPase